MKTREIQKLSKAYREKKLQELKLELVKSKAKAGSSKASQIRKIIARILTLNNQNKQIVET